MRNPINSDSAIVYLAAGLAAAVVAAGMVLVSPKPAAATPAYAAQTGYACGRCHVSASGGGALTKFGSNWAKHRH